jgi:type VI secretion system protein ImpC
VRIEYDVEVYGATTTIQLPFVIGVLADLSGKPEEPPPPVAERKFLEIDADSFDSVLEAMKPRVAFRVPNTLTGDGDLNVEMTFESMDDFSPAAVARRVQALSRLLEARSQLSDLLAYTDGRSDAEELIAHVLNDPELVQSLAQSQGVAAEPDAVDGVQAAAPEPTEVMTLIRQRLKPSSDRAIESVGEAIRTLAVQALEQTWLIGDDAVQTIDGIIAEIDRRLTEQINPILHHPDFGQLEGSWRGLHYLVGNTETDETLKVRVLSISKRELHKTLKKFKGVAWDQSPIFKQVYTNEYDMFGGEPFGCLVGDYYFDHSPWDVELLLQMAQIGAAAHAPFIAGADPRVMQMESWQELGNPRDLTKIFQTPEYAAWRSLRESEVSRYLVLTMPRFLGRLPYGGSTRPVKGLDFEEHTEADDERTHVWINSAYAMACNTARAFRLYGWCARICGLESGGAVENLPLPSKADRHAAGRAALCPTEVNISGRRESELASLGLCALLHRKGTDCAAFLSTPSLHAPREYEDPAVTFDAQRAADLAFVLTSGQFLRSLRCLIRDRTAAFKEDRELEVRLNRWLNDYVEPNPLACQVDRARRPLLGAEVRLEGEGSNKSMKIFLLPYHQLERLCTDIPKSMALRQTFRTEWTDTTTE